MNEPQIHADLFLTVSEGVMVAGVVGIVLTCSSPAFPQSRNSTGTSVSQSTAENFRTQSQTYFIIIDTDKNAKYELASAADGVMFDIDGDGELERIAWTKADSGVSFLALDRDGDGRITSGKELFGNHTVPGSPDGFDALQKTAMETNGGIKRHSVSSDDPVFAHLLLWTDRNHNLYQRADGTATRWRSRFRHRSWVPAKRESRRVRK